MPNLENKVVTNMMIYIDDSSHNSPAYVYAKQYDANSRYITVKLMSSGGQIRATGAVQLNATKPNGGMVYIGGTINADGTATFGLTANLLTDVGRISCDISVFDTEDTSQILLTSSTFYIIVDKSNYDADAIEGSDEFSTITDALAQIAADKAAAEEAAETAQEISNNIENTLMTKADGLIIETVTEADTQKNYLSLTAEGEKINGSTVQVAGITDINALYDALSGYATTTDLSGKADGLELTDNKLYLLSDGERITEGIVVTTDLSAIYAAIGEKADGLTVVGNTLQLTSNGALIGEAIALPQSIADVEIGTDNNVHLVDEGGHQIGEGAQLPMYASDVTTAADGDNTRLFLVDENGDTMGGGVILPAGGGGGGGGGTSTISIQRVTNSPVITTQSSSVILQYQYSSVDSQGDDVDGTYIWKRGSTIIASGNALQGSNSFDVSSFLSVGTQKFTLTITDINGGVASKTWTVQVISLRIESNFNDGITYEAGKAVNFSYTPYGSIMKTIHFILDGVELDTVDTGVSGVLSSYSLPAQTHGAHMLECYITANINETIVETDHIFKDIVWYDTNSTVPVIGCICRCLPVPDDAAYDENLIYYYINNGIYAEYTGGDADWTSRPQLYYQHVTNTQYNSTLIPYYVFDPNTATPTVTRKADNVIVSEETMSSSEGTWSYRTGNIGLHTLNIACRATSIDVIINIEELGIDVRPVTGGLAFDFSPEGYSNASELRLWADDNNADVAMAVSDNFDWNNGGYQIDSDGNQYFCVKAGTTASFSYNLFERDAAIYGSELKIIFKTTNVKNAAATWMNCVAGAIPVGLKMNVHEANFYTSTNSLYMPYSEDDIIEFELNINAIGSSGLSGQGLIMSYEDGVGMRPLVYDTTHRLYQYADDVLPITIGSEDCDVHIYRMKAYENALSDSDILSNFIADSRDAEMMLARYNRNQIYDENSVLTPESLADACPQLRIIKIDCPHLTNDKKDYVKGTNVECIYKGGDAVLDNWVFTNAYHAGQGTTSNEYGYSGRNLDVIFGFDGEHDPTGKIKNIDPNYKTELTLGDGTKYFDGTGEISLTRTSIPNNWFNIKVNIASSENANNALLQKRYNDFLPYKTRRQNIDSRVKNSMEFVNCVVFVREYDQDLSTHREFTDTEWHYYALGNIGDSKKTDLTRADDPSDLKEFVIEVSDNTLPNSTFQTGVTYDSDVVEGGLVIHHAGDMKYPIMPSEWAIGNPKYDYLYGISIKDGGNNYLCLPVAASAAYDENTVYYYDSEGVYTQYTGGAEGWASRPQLYRRLKKTKKAVDGWDESFEFRYDMGGGSKDGVITATNAEQDAQRLLNKQVFRDFYEWIITSTDDEFVSHLEDWCVPESMFYLYLFTLRYTMIDNRAKNTFWHWGRRYISQENATAMEVAAEGSSAGYIIDDEKAAINDGYRFDMWDYDNDTALGINNSGELTMPYGKEDTDYKVDGDAESGYIFNGAENVFWCRIRDLCGSQLHDLYQLLDSENCWSDVGLISEYDAWQEQFPEEIWRIDIERKYYRTYTGQSVDNSIAGESTPRFLTQMMNGRKKYQRRQFERDQAIYMGTKFLSTSVTSDQIMFRCNTPVQAVIPPNYDLTIVPYSDMYVSVRFGNHPTVNQIRAKSGQEYTIDCPLTVMDDTAVLIYGASRIQALNDLSACYIHDNDFSKATKIQTLVIGNETAGYSNSFLTTLNIGDNRLLTTLDVRNCPSLTGSLNLSGCGNLETLRAQGTSLTGVTFAVNGKISSAYLPDTITSIFMSNLRNLTTANLDLDYAGLESVTIKDSVVDSKAIVIGGQDTIMTLALSGINWELPDINLLETIYNMPRTALSGNIHINGSISSRYLSKYNAKWRDLNVTYETYVQEYMVTFQNDDGTVLDVQWVERGGTAVNPLTREENPIETPTKASTIDTEYTFSAWDSDAYLSAIYGALTITATYTASARIYTVRFYVNGVLTQTSPAGYGDGVEYDYETYGEPTKPDDVEHDIYYLWAGWDKNHYRIYGDTNVNAIFVEGVTPGAPADPGNKPRLNTRSIEEINAICRSGQKDWERVYRQGTPSSFEQRYFDIGDEIDITTGWEPDDDESNAHLIYDLASSPCTLHYSTEEGDEGTPKTGGMLLPLTLNQNTNDVSSDNSDPMYLDTGISLMYNNGVNFGIDDNYEFTWVLDFALNDTTVYGGNVSSEPNILDCVATNDGYDHGFKVYAASNGQCSLKYAASSMTVASGSTVSTGLYLVTDPDTRTYTESTADMFQSYLERIIVRKKKGERGITVYRCNPTSDTYSTSTMSYAGNDRVPHSRTVLLGCGRSAYGYPNASMLANCTIYNFKIWNVAMSDLEMAKMAIAPKETLKYRLQAFPRTTYGATASYNYMASLGIVTENNQDPAPIYPGISLGSTNLMRNYRTMNSSSTNVGGWDASLMRSWMNDRLFKSFPQVLKSAIKTVNVRASVGGGAETPPDTAYELRTSRDKLFLWSIREYNGYTQSPYSDEGKVVPLYSNNATRLKYREFGHVMFYWWYWTRSPYLFTAAYFCRVYGGGSSDSYTGAPNGGGVAPGLCI